MDAVDFSVDYYLILGVDSGATSAQIRRAYRRLAQRYHPDASEDEQTVDRFREVQVAYEVLSDPAKRKAYDFGRQRRGYELEPAIELRLTSSQRLLRSSDEPQMLYILVEARARARAERLPMNLSLVLDQSTSMKGHRLEQVRRAALWIIEQLTASDWLSVVTFSDRAELAFSGRPPDNLGATRRSIRSIQAGGGTEIYHGLEAGLRELQRHSRPPSLDILLLLTDGHTYGDENRCLDLARQAQQRQTMITTFGIGREWNEELLEELAQQGGGQCHYVESSRQITVAFEEWFRGLNSACARDLRLGLHLPQGVSLLQAYRSAPRIERLDFGTGPARLGTLEATRPHAAVLELLVEPFPPGPHRVAEVELEAELLGTPDGQYLAQREIVVDFQEQPTDATTIPPEIVAVLGKLAVYKMQEKIMDDLAQGQVSSATQRLETLATRLLDLGETQLARAALLEAGQVSRTGRLSQGGRKRIRYGTSYLTHAPRDES